MPDPNQLDRVREFFEHCPFAMALVSANGYFIEATQSVADLLEVTLDELKTMTYQEVTHPDDLAPDTLNHEALIRGDIKSYAMFKRYITKTGIKHVLLAVGLAPGSTDAYAFITEVTRSKLAHGNRIGLYAEIDRGLNRDKFELHYQPIVCLTTRETKGYEALIRWKRWENKYCMPDEWLPYLDTEHQKKICSWVMHKAVHDIQRLDDRFIAVNISPKSFYKPSFANKLIDITRQHNAPSKRIWIELTEELKLQSPTHIVDILRKAGHTVVIDDFGSGTANINSLFSFNADIIKLDKEIVRHCQQDGFTALIQSLQTLSKSNDRQYKLIAEGIEDELTATILEDIGVDYGQGWLFGKPALNFQ